MLNFSNNLRSLRLSHHMSQKELALKLSVTSSLISAYENNLRLPSYDILINIANIFDCSCDYLLGMDTSLHSNHKYIDVTDLSQRQIEALQFTIDAFRNN